MSPSQIQEAYNLHDEPGAAAADEEYGVTVAEVPCPLSVEDLSAVQQINPTSESSIHGRDICLHVLQLASSAFVFSDCVDDLTNF